jgi:hypothetical protein
VIRVSLRLLLSAEAPNSEGESYKPLTCPFSGDFSGRAR